MILEWKYALVIRQPKWSILVLWHSANLLFYQFKDTFVIPTPTTKVFRLAAILIVASHIIRIFELTFPIMHFVTCRPVPNLPSICTKFLMDLWDYAGLSSGEQCILCGNALRTWRFEVWRCENQTQTAVCLVCYRAIIGGLKCLITCQNALECAINKPLMTRRAINSEIHLHTPTSRQCSKRCLLV